MKIQHIILKICLLISSISASAQNNFDIIYCRANWTLSPDTLYIEGNVTTHFKPLSGCNKIDFDLASNMIVDSIVNYNGKLTYTFTDNKIVINLENKLTPELTDSITIYYHGSPISTGYGSFKIDKKHKTLWTLSESYGAKDWWPCRQNLYDKIDSIDIYVKCPMEYEVASNGILISDVADNEWHTVHYKEQHPITYYMVGVAVGVYEIHKSKALLHEQKIMETIDYVWPDTRYSNENLIYISNLLNLFGNYFIPFPFSDEKYGQAQINWDGGIEHQTMTFLYDFEPVIMAHELAHQWFGNYVTCKGWRNIWINEGFASYSEYLALKQFYPNDTTRWKLYNLQYALKSINSIYVEDTTNIDSIFDKSTTYCKGAMVMAMLRNEIGDKAFFNGCRDLLKQHADGFASVDDAKNCFESAADTCLTEFFNNWIYGKGHPIYDVIYNTNDHGMLNVSICQTTSCNSTKFFPMHVTLRIIGENNQLDVKLHNTSPQQCFTIPIDFDVINVIFDPMTVILCKSKVTRSSN